MTLTMEQLAEINALRNNGTMTLRPVCSALEEIIYQPFYVLDHGFVRLIDYMGDDTAIVQAARVSYGKGTKLSNADRGLINYLMHHQHTTPFEMCELKLHVKMPIFVARQWIRHRTASVNEYSARYSIMENEFYIPAEDQIAAQSTNNHQGRNEGHPLSAEELTRVMELLKNDAAQCYDHYVEMVNEDDQGNPLDPNRSGLARELARMDLTINCYTQLYWKIDLHNLLHFLRLRADSHAQYEIRVYAEIILHEIVKRWVPYTYDAFLNYQVGGKNLSAGMLSVIKRLLHGEQVTQANSDLGKREWAEFQELFALETEAK